MKTGIETIKFNAPCVGCKESVKIEAVFNWDTTELKPGQKINCPKCGFVNFIQFNKEAWEKTSQEERIRFIKSIFDVVSQTTV